MAIDREIESIRDSLVLVVAEWSRNDLQASVAAELDAPLDATEVRALYTVGAGGGSLGFSELAERASLSRPTASKLVSRMSAQGLFDRIRSGRTVVVRLTDDGIESYARLVAAGQQMVGEALAGWTPHEIADFQTSLSRFVVALPGASRATVSPVPPDTVPSTQEET